MEFEGCSQDVAKSAWRAHCAGFGHLTEEVMENADSKATLTLFREYLLAPDLHEPPSRYLAQGRDFQEDSDPFAHLTAPNNHRHWFVLHLPLMSREAQEGLCRYPQKVLPMLEFLKSLIHFNKTGVAVLCAVRIDPSGIVPFPFDCLGTERLSQLICVEGTVVRMSTVRPKCKSIDFRCGTCGSIFPRAIDSVIEAPMACEGGKPCKGRYFHLVPDSAKCHDIQRVRIQEMQPANGSLEKETVGSASLLEVELQAEFVGQISPGDTIVAVGVLLPERAPKIVRSQAGARQAYLTAIGVSTSAVAKGSLSVSSAGLETTVTVPRLDGKYPPQIEAAFVREVQSAKSEEQWMETLVSAFCPAIYGHQLSKQALILALVGGTEKAHTRSNIHVAIVGDPGIGKSVLLRSVCNAAPRSVFVSANTSSKVGLTVSLTRDPISNETTLETGAVMHGDGGVTCIDEIDKGTNDHKALLEVMEQETLSLAKAGVLLSVPVKTSIIAAGNPSKGRYDPSMSLCDNLNVSTALLSRFDFIFVLADDPKTSSTDDALTNHVLKLHKNQKLQAESPLVSTPSATSHIDSTFVCHFLAYAKHFKPVLLPEAAEALKAAYLHARQAQMDQSDLSLARVAGGVLASESSDLPVTPRYLQSLVRAAEARAKCSLSHTVQLSHAQFAINLLESSRRSRYMASVASPRGTASGPRLEELNRIGAGGKRSLKDRIVIRLAMILRDENKEVLTRGEIEEVCNIEKAKNCDQMIHDLNGSGILLSTAGGKFRLKRQL